MTTPRLNKSMLEQNQNLPEKMIQFGEGNFMRGFVDWQLQQMNNRGLFNGKAVLVQPINQGLGEMMAEQDCLYTVLLEGITEGKVVSSAEIITSVSRVINPYADYEAYLALAENDDLEIITSNTTEAGIAYRMEDQLTDAPPASFPAKLTALLHKRFELGKKGFVIIPCELIDRNGEKLKEIVLKYADLWNLGSDFVAWLENENTFCCSLVDRIVPGYPRDRVEELTTRLGYEDRLIVMAEPFLFWVIEGPEWLNERLPLTQAGLNVVITNDMTPYRERKVHLLNGPHTAMVPVAMLAGLETVESVMKDADFSTFVANLLSKELIPMLDLPHDELTAYAGDVVERFLNPFIRHELASISLNSISKFKTRLLPILLRYQNQREKLPQLLTLAFSALLLSYRGDKVKRADGEDVIAVFDAAWSNPSSFVPTILANEALWGQDLNTVAGLADALQQTITMLDSQGARDTLNKFINEGVIV